MSKVELPKLLGFGSRSGMLATVGLADVLAALMRDGGFDPKSKRDRKLLARQAGFKSEMTIFYILRGHTRRPQRATMEGLVKVLCGGRPGSADLFWLAAGYLPVETPP